MNFSIKNLLFGTFIIAVASAFWVSCRSKYNSEEKFFIGVEVSSYEFELYRIAPDLGSILEVTSTQKEIVDFLEKVGLSQRIATRAAEDLKHPGVSSSEKLVLLIFIFNEISAEPVEIDGYRLHDSDNDGLHEIWFRDFEFCIDEFGGIYARKQNKEIRGYRHLRELPPANGRAAPVVDDPELLSAAQEFLEKGKQQGGADDQSFGYGQDHDTVSYTHLTLPTKA